MPNSIAVLLLCTGDSLLRATLSPHFLDTDFVLRIACLSSLQPKVNLTTHSGEDIPLPVAGPPSDVQERTRQQCISVCMWTVKPRTILSLLKITELNMQFVIVTAHMGSSLSEWH